LAQAVVLVAAEAVGVVAWALLRDNRYIPTPGPIPLMDVKRLSANAQRYLAAADPRRLYGDA
jgi:hypothetical protein